MKQALAVRKDDNKVSPFKGWNILSGNEFEDLFAENNDAQEKLDLRCPETGAPVIFKPGYRRNGFQESVNAHFAYASGYAPKESHIFDDGHRYQSIKDALENNAKILLSLNLDLTYQNLDLSSTNDDNITALDMWKHGHNYQSVSITDIDQLVLAVQRVKNLGYNPAENIYISSRNAVLPFDDFYMGHKDKRFESLYKDLLAQKSGTAVGSERMIGFPRMIRFELADKAIKDNAARGLRGNFMPFANEENASLSFLILSEKDEILKQTQKRDIFNQAIKSGRGIYVLACPTISSGHAQDKDFLRMIRWVVNKPEAQIRIAPKEREVQNLSEYKLA